MKRQESSWHTPTAHYAVVPNWAWYSGPGPWALVAFTSSGEKTLAKGSYGECCRALAALRTQQERSRAG